MSLQRCYASLSSISLDGVERDAAGVPIAFRIWRAGDNPTDMGVHTFTARSASLLMKDQAVRGNLYSIDADHMSLDKQAPPEARKAVGWHRIEVRAGELWAVDVEWTDAVRAGLTKTPPEWRYFSPAYDTEKKTGEIVSYLNTALTNNPATWSVTALASATSTRSHLMNLQGIAAALFGDDPEKKKEARAAIAAMNPLEQKAWKAFQKAALEEAPEKEPDGDEATKAAEEPKEPKEPESAKAAEDPKEPDGDEATKAHAASIAKLGEQDRRIAELEKIQEREERARVLATRPDLTAAQLKVLAAEPLSRLPKLLELIPAPAVDPAAASRVTASRGETRNGNGGTVGFGGQRAARLPPKENAELRQRMGTADETTKGVHWDPERPSDLVFPPMRPDEARRILASRAKAGLDGDARDPADRAAIGGAR